MVVKINTIRVNHHDGLVFTRLLPGTTVIGASLMPTLNPVGHLGNKDAWGSVDAFSNKKMGVNFFPEKRPNPGEGVLVKDHTFPLFF